MALLYLDADMDAKYPFPFQAMGHDLLTSRQAGRLRAHDEEQLAFAAEPGRILITHNGDDYLLLQRAWRHWPNAWNLPTRPIHAGILVVPQQSPLTIEQIVLEIDAFIRSGIRLENRYFEFSVGDGWIQKG
jgi:uncharacterized protein DUF5615